MSLKLQTLMAMLAYLAIATHEISAAPPVLVLKRGEVLPHGGSKLQPVVATGYPYGYFGAHGGTHWSRHSGILGNYQQFTRR